MTSRWPRVRGSKVPVKTAVRLRVGLWGIGGGQWPAWVGLRCGLDGQPPEPRRPGGPRSSALL